jgi:perosamine synthetase
MNKFISLSVPNIKGNELQYVTEVIKDEWVSTGGAAINVFEKNMAKYVHVKAAAACQSGTAGLHLSLVANGIGGEHEVIVPTLTFIAAVNPVKYVGAEPIFMDCDDSLCMDMDKLKKFCMDTCVFEDGKLINKKTNKHIKAVIVVHVFGNIADMEKLMALAEEYNLIVIEDATEALGSYIKEGKYQGKFAGTIGDVGVYSFNGNKIITTGGGGMVVSNNESMIEKVKYLSQQAKDDMIYFIHHEIGYNYRMTNVQAAMGIAQLERLEEFIEKKQDSFQRYIKLGIPLLGFREDIRSNYWFYSYITEQRDELIAYMQEENIQTRPIWHLIHNLIPYKNCQAFEIDKAFNYWQKVVNIPCSTNLLEEDIAYIAQTILEFNSKTERCGYK